MKKASLFLLLFFVMTACFSEDLGVYGQLYDILEPDFLLYIQSRLIAYKENGSLRKMQSEFKKRAQEAIVHPKAVEGIRDVNKKDKPLYFFYTPNIRLQENIKNEHGDILYRKGMKINPLDKKQIASLFPSIITPVFHKTLIFINADNPNQVSFVKNSIKEKSDFQYKIILTKGNIKTASGLLGRIYFDQGGRLCKQFGIKRVPAILRQQGVLLAIEEPVI